MGRRGRHRDFRERVLAIVEERDPALYAELVELRGRNPQAYRKRIREIAKVFPIDGVYRLISNRLVYSKVNHLTEIDELLAADDVYTLRAALRRGHFADRLDAIEAAERAGQNRPYVLHVLEEWHRRLASRAAQAPPPSGLPGALRNVPHRLQLPEAEPEVDPDPADGGDEGA